MSTPLKSRAAAVEDSSELLAEPDWLVHRRGAERLVLIDTRPAAEFRAGHLAGARHFDPFPFHYYDTSERGLKEFNSQLEWIFSALGICGDETVVFYDNQAGMRAARGAWLLHYAGHRAARMLDGGLAAMQAAGLAGRLSTTPAPITPSAFTLQPRPEVIASYDYVLSRLGHGASQIFDVRSDAEYWGENVRARHGGAIPLALHREWTDALDSAGRFKSPAELRAVYERLGLDRKREVITYCQGGYRAAHAWVALRTAGFTRVRNYLSSWAEWGNRDDAPIERVRRPTGAG